MNRIKKLKAWKKGSAEYVLGIESGDKQIHYKTKIPMDSIVVQVKTPKDKALEHIEKWGKVYVYYHFQYDELKMVIDYLAEKYGKVEVEKELGIKIDLGGK
jgi:mRNA degradation ribonuclease J1/J2